MIKTENFLGQKSYTDLKKINNNILKNQNENVKIQLNPTNKLKSISNNRKNIYQIKETKKPIKKRKKLYITLLILLIFILIIVIATITVLILNFFDKKQSNNDSCNTTCSNGYSPSLVNNICKCIDIDECNSNLHNCKLGYNCSNTPGSFSCIDINECIESTVCGSGEICTNLNGSFKCTCKFGYESTNTSCQDINECRLNSTIYSCPDSYTCSNTDGSYGCCRDLLNNNSSIKDCYSCGLQYSKPALRIVGGVVTEPYSWPWFVSIGKLIGKFNKILTLFCFVC
jgi:hypothetical protein